MPSNQGQLAPKPMGKDPHNVTLANLAGCGGAHCDNVYPLVDGQCKATATNHQVLRGLLSSLLNHSRQEPASSLEMRYHT